MNDLTFFIYVAKDLEWIVTGSSKTDAADYLLVSTACTIKNYMQRYCACLQSLHRKNYMQRYVLVCTAYTGKIICSVMCLFPQPAQGKHHCINEAE